MAGEPSELDLAYVAGFFDGEGNVSIRRARPMRPTQNIRYSLMVTIVNSDLPTLEYISSMLGGVIHRRKPMLLTRRLLYHLYWCGGDAQAFLRVILPYLKVKAREANLGMSFQDVMSVSSGGNKYHRVSQLDIDIREAFYKSCRKLKQPANIAGEEDNYGR